MYVYTYVLMLHAQLVNMNVIFLHPNVQELSSNGSLDIVKKWKTNFARMSY